jgi:preprotein translocase subunit Sec61beta
MMIRIPLAVLALTLVSTALGAQTDIPASPDAALMANTLQAPLLDPRLVVSAAAAETAGAQESEAWKDVVTRPWWHYPAIGGAIGAAAGVIHAHAIMQGDPIGIPFDPRYVLPAAYGAAGAFLGILIDSAERERAARR